MSALPPIATAKADMPKAVMSAFPPKADVCGAKRTYLLWAKSGHTRLAEIFEWDAAFTLSMQSSLSAARASTMPTAQLFSGVLPMRI
jgi:hypothetical protein